MLATLGLTTFLTLPATAFLPSTSFGLQQSPWSRHQRSPSGAQDRKHGASSLSEGDVDRSAADKSSDDAVELTAAVVENAADSVEDASAALLEACEGLDRGAAADAAAAATVGRCVKELEEVAPCNLLDGALVDEALVGR